MKINYSTLAVLSVFVLFAGVLMTHQPVLAQGAGAVIDGELTKVDATAKTRLTLRIAVADLRNFALRRRAHMMPSETWS